MAVEIAVFSRPSRAVVEVAIEARTRAGTVELLVRGSELHRLIRLSPAEAKCLTDEMLAAVAAAPIDVLAIPDALPTLSDNGPNTDG